MQSRKAERLIMMDNICPIHYVPNTVFQYEKKLQQTKIVQNAPSVCFVRHLNKISSESGRMFIV